LGNFQIRKKNLSLKSSSFHSLYCFGQIITEKLCSFKIKKISGHFFFGIGTDNEQQKAYGYGPKYRILISSFGGISANNTHKITMIKN